MAAIERRGPGQFRALIRRKGHPTVSATFPTRELRAKARPTAGHIEARPVKPNTVRLELAILGHLYTVARTEWGMEGLASPLKAIRKPKPGNGRERRLEPGEEARLLRACAGVDVGGDFSRMPGILTDGVAMFGWFRPTASGNRVLAALAQNASAGELIWLDYVSGQIGGQYRDGDGVITPTRQSAPLNQWAFACVTYNRATRECAVCINGSFQRMVKTSNGTQSNAKRYLGLGSIYSNTVSGADVDAFGLADHPLTDEEILWLYNGGTGREFSDLAS